MLLASPLRALLSALLLPCAVPTMRPAPPRPTWSLDHPPRPGLQEYSGGVPAQVAQMVQRQVAALRGSGPSLLTKLLAAAAGMAALGGAALWWRAHHGGGGGPGDLGSELRSVSERMTIAQRRLQ